jgi:type II secretory pathway component PulF
MKYITAMIYPAILIFIIILSLVVIFKMILPGFLNIVSSFPGASLPESTQILMKINNFFQNY